MIPEPGSCPLHNTFSIPFMSRNQTGKESKYTVYLCWVSVYTQIDTQPSNLYILSMERLIFSGQIHYNEQIPRISLKQPWTTGCKVVVTALESRNIQIIPFIYGPVSGDKHCFYSQIPHMFHSSSPTKPIGLVMKHHTKDYMWSLTAPLLYESLMHQLLILCSVKPRSCNYWVHAPKQLKPSQREPVAPQQEKPQQ